MAKTFLDRNKKKSLLALLLLFLRERKVLVLLLFLVLMASTVFLSPSSWITSLPGGTRFVAGMAWIAGKAGVDVSRWGLGPAPYSYGDLLRAFQIARMDAGGPGGNGVGWGAFFGRAAGPIGDVPNSLDMVKGSKADLVAGTGTVKAIINPDDSKRAGDSGVAITQADLGGEREGLVTQAFAGGFVNGFLGTKTQDDLALSGGAYASKQFFTGPGGPAGASAGDTMRGGLSGMTRIAVPPSRIGGAAKGTLSSMASKLIDIHGQKGILNVTSLNTHTAYGDLAQTNGQGLLSTQYCQPPACPAEFAATNSGAVYDGNYITAGFLTGSDPAAQSAGLIAPSVTVPPVSDLGGDQTASEAATCENDAMTCAQTEQSMAAGTPGGAEGFGGYQDQINKDVPHLGKACDRVCSCDACSSLNNDIQAQCTGIKNLSDSINSYTASCNASMPADCNSLGINTPPNSMNMGANCPSMSCHECPHILGVCVCWL